MLIKARAGGVSPNMTAEVLGRSYHAVLSRSWILQRAGVLVRVDGMRNAFTLPDDWEDRLTAVHEARRCRGTGKTWTTADDDAVCVLELDGKTVPEIAAATGRTESAIQARLVKLRQEGELAPANRPWTEEERSDLWGMFYGGLDDANIAKKLGRSALATIKMRQSMGLKRSARGLPLLG